jgi:chromosome partitioning protein
VSVPVIAFFNNKGGVGKTSTVYHVAWMLSEKGLRVIAADLDPQANLTAAFLDDDRLEQLMDADGHSLTVFGSVHPLKEGTGDIADPHVEIVSERLGLIPGDMALSTFEDDLSEVRPKCLEHDPRALRVTSAFWRLVQKSGLSHGADVILLDLGPNLGAINRASLIAADFVVIPLSPDLFSILGLQNLGPALRDWREGWRKRRGDEPLKDLPLPLGGIQPIGYLVLRHTLRMDRPVQAFERWMARMPASYSEAVLGQAHGISGSIDEDPHCLAKLKDYRSLMPLAQEARKPIFQLKPADGALGAHTYAVGEAYADFRKVASRIAAKAGLKELQ